MQFLSGARWLRPPYIGVLPYSEGLIGEPYSTTVRGHFPTLLSRLPVDAHRCESLHGKQADNNRQEQLYEGK